MCILLNSNNNLFILAIMLINNGCKCKNTFSLERYVLIVVPTKNLFQFEACADTHFTYQM